jgi:hypothetical protein
MNGLIPYHDYQLDWRHQSDLDERVSESFGVDPGVEYAVESKCIHCDPTFVPTGEDGWCECECHDRALRRVLREGKFK